MSASNKVAWSEGLFLRPQLFQQQERYVEHFAHARAKPLSPFYWGFSHLQIDSESLYFGKLVVSKATGLFVDGTAFDAPGLTDAPPPLSILPEHLNKLIYLALPIRTPNGEETTFEDRVDSLARNVVFDADVRDTNSVGQGAKTIQLAKLRLRLLPEQELSSAWMGLPIARVRSINSDNSVELDTDFIHPVNIYGSSEKLLQWLMQLHGNLLQRAQMLAQRITGAGSVDRNSAVEVSDFLVLQLLNRYEPLFAHYLQVKETHPDQLYMMLRSMSSELATFIRTETRRPISTPNYQHIDPYLSFKLLVDDIREQLNKVMVRSAEKIELELREHGLRLASVDPSKLKEFSGLVLAVTASIPVEQIANQIPTLSKVGTADRITELVKFHLPGLTLSVMPVAPRQIPFSTGYVYFYIEPRGPLWDHMQNTGSIALHVASDLPNMKTEIWAIR